MVKLKECIKNIVKAYFKQASLMYTSRYYTWG